MQISEKMDQLPMCILERIMSFNMTPWCIGVSRRLQDAEEGVTKTRFSYIDNSLEYLARLEIWDELVYMVHMTDKYADVDTIYYVADSGRYITAKVLVERLYPHISRLERRDLLRNLMGYEETSIIEPLISSFKDVWDAKYMIKYGWGSLIQKLVDIGWDVKGISFYACKYGRVEIYAMTRSRYKERNGRWSTISMAMVAANHDWANILEHIVKHEVSEDKVEDLLSHIYEETWSPIIRSYIDDRGREDSIMSTISTCTHTEDLELLYDGSDYTPLYLQT